MAFSDSSQRIIRAGAAAFAAGSLFLVSACSDGSSSDSSSASSENTSASASADGISIVTSTSIWADIAKEVAGDGTNIQAIVTGNDVDPHHFEPSAADIAKAKDADLVVAGGGGYDAWLYQAVDQDKVIHALPLTEHHHHHHGEGEEAHEHEHSHEGEEAHEHEHEHGHSHEGEEGHEHHHHGDREGAETNEHVWYDVDALIQVANDVASRVKQIDSSAKVDSDSIDARLGKLKERISKLPHLHTAQTEPIADYIIGDSEIHDITPEGYRESSLDHGEASAADLKEFLDLIDSGELDFLIYNPQTETDLTKKIHDAAEAKGLPIVEIAETPEADQNFLDYFESVVEQLEKQADAASHGEQKAA
ncbi:zinc ABC transporter substrate-binding protein [Corynebacterium uropygiale]|uniref:Zinc ABC transporter substrate-binding protein n=1 Tax=Corynebacterium uropygiale TaxID=1775911 RepID=A0A9X1QPU9_9CORY|nr:zinc ABC transporter substrate-binding protein [Corynebacterium uropygiale]MCF4007149.1 zinc ABC transporter substrate-binding protein [Corynebacterium uropygiale]